MKKNDDEVYGGRVIPRCMLDDKFVDVNRVKSVVETTYDVKEYIEGLIFTKRKSQLEMLLYAKKIFEGGKLSKHEWLDYKAWESSEKEDDVVRRNICEYRNGVEVTHRGYNANGKLIYEEKLEYYSNGLLMRNTELRHKSDENTEERITVHKYDSHGNEVEWSVEFNIIDNKGVRGKRGITSSYQIWKYRFTEEGRVEFVEEVDGVHYGDYFIAHFYDHNDRLVREYFYHGNRADYNERGEIVRLCISGRCDFEYRYDDKGNWIEKKRIRVYSNGSVQDQLVTREIEYLY